MRRRCITARMSDLTLRLRNRARRLRNRAPHHVVSPLVPDNVFQAHVSLFDFFAAFCANRNVLWAREHAAWGAYYMRQRGVATIDVMLSKPAENFSKRHYALDGISYGQRSGPYDVSIGQPFANLAPNGILLFPLPPTPHPEVEVEARKHFAHVRRFVHYATEPLDLASPVATVTPDAFRFRELREQEPYPPNTLGQILMCTNDPKWRDLKLHLGCGPVALPGWVNVDNLPYPGVDFMWDLVRGIPFREARLIFAEHFIEHLSYSDARAFVAQCREVLRYDGVLRLTTPNLDWVWQVSYHPQQWTDRDQPVRECFVTNRAFRGWGHQFLYNFPTLASLMRNAGFRDVEQQTYGQSRRRDLVGLEHHTPYPDTPELPHVIVAEGSGRRSGTVAIEHEDAIAEYERDVAVR